MARKKVARGTITASAAMKKKQRQTNNRTWSIVLFALGLLFLLLALLKGDSGWTIAHNFICGLVGWCAIILGPLLMYISVIVEGEKRKISIAREVNQGFALILLLGIVTHIIQFEESDKNTDWMGRFVEFYEQGAKHGGGALSGILALPLVKFCGIWGAGIVTGILILLLVMLVFRITIIDVYRHIKVRQTAKEAPKGPTKSSGTKQEESGKKNKTWFRQIAKEADEFGVLEQEADAKAFEFEDDLQFDQIEENQLKFLSLVDKKRSWKSAGPATAEKGKSPFDADKEENAALEDGYRLPGLDLLNQPKPQNTTKLNEELKVTANKLIETLKSFGVGATIVDISRGPSVTRYELQPSVGVKINKITGLSDDIALNLATVGVRIEAPVPNKAAVGIEVPNKTTTLVNIREALESEPFEKNKSNLTIALGKDIAGNFTVADIAKMPHVLIAGSTGSGKSVCINSIIISLIYKSSPNDVKLLMIDPKVVELGVYNGIPHLLVPVVTDAKKAAGALGWAVCEMLNRYKLFAENSVRDLEKYNKLASVRDDLEKLPQIVVIIDELADLMMVAPSEVEDSICRLAQMARAAGMHLVVATQRPSVDVVTGIIKANIPSRIAFAVSSQVDSRTILDSSGAEKLLGRGDMLFLPMGGSKPIRVQGCLVTDKEVERVVEFIKEEQEVDYSDEVEQEIERLAVKEKDLPKAPTSERDDMLNTAIRCIIEMGQASTSLLQRRLKIGYSRAARLIDEMEERGIVGESDGSKARKVMISKREWLEMQNRKNL
ncbi:MAG: DNA translocase FtsK [Oscillospiraceae bacterium]|jgi:S-DNA-T family DNA segregation ATPase FtsK/SpoIIIE|nr:DNA translocase FtsK [Oscillospiraceae bacterium]